MTLDYDGLDHELIEALRRDSAASVVPDGARRRVELRLASAGAVGLGASVAGATQAAAMTSAVRTVTTTTSVGATSGGVLASVTFAGLAKTLAVGLGVGAGVGLGLHVAFAPRSAASRVVAASTARSRSGDVGVSTRPLPSGAAKLGPGADTAANADATTAAPTTNSRPVRAGAQGVSEAAALHARAAQFGEAQVNPAPELPKAPAAVASAQGLSEQQRLLDRARAALGRGDASSALAFVAEHARAFPRTAFEEERELLSIEALVALGRASEAGAQAKTFQRRFPRSVFLPSLERALTPERQDR